MCYFVFVGVPKAHRHQVDALCSLGFEVSEWSGLPIKAVFPREDSVVCVTSGGCSCGIYHSALRGFDESAARRKYEKKGWTKAKIERAMLGRRRGQPEQPVFARFREGFANVVRAVGSVRVFAHVFTGDVESEHVAACAERSLLIEDYLAAHGFYDADTIWNIGA
jgi:hypothetical protein